MKVDRNQLTVLHYIYKFAVFVLLVNSFNALVDCSHCDFDCLHPRRPETEALFNAIGHHERSANLKEMMDKLNVRISVLK